MESVRCARAMGRGIGEWIDNLQLLDDRAGPPVGDDQWQRTFVFRTNMKEMNVEAVDRRHELRKRIQLCLDLAPIVVRPPIARDFLHRRELYALRFIGDRFAVGPPCRVDAPEQIDQRLFRNVDAEGTDFLTRGRRRRIRRKKARDTAAMGIAAAGVASLFPAYPAPA